MLFGSLADKATMDLRGDTHHESARVRAFRQRLRDDFTRRGHIGENLTHGVGEARESLDRGAREPGQRRELCNGGDMFAVLNRPCDSIGVVGCVRHHRHLPPFASRLRACRLPPVPAALGTPWRCHPSRAGCSRADRLAKASCSPCAKCVLPGLTEEAGADLSQVIEADVLRRASHLLDDLLRLAHLPIVSIVILLIKTSYRRTRRTRRTRAGLRPRASVRRQGAGYDLLPAAGPTGLAVNMPTKPLGRDLYAREDPGQG
jgi:hypothetical protein